MHIVIPETNRAPAALTSVPRRHVLAALSGAALAGGALVLAMPIEAPAAITQPGADAELIRLCADYHRRHAEWRAPFVSDDVNDALRDIRDAALARVAAMPHQTADGLLAKAAVAFSAMMFDVHTYINQPWREEATPEQMVTLDVLAAFVGKGAAT